MSEALPSTLPWSQRTTEIAEAGLRRELAATAAERAAITQELGLVSCEAIEVSYTIRALGGGRYRLAGSLRARLTQACVATLEPLPQTIEEGFEVQFWPVGSLPAMGDVEVEASSVPEVEPIEHGSIGVGRVVFETLSAALDPYPRKSGASLEWQDAESAEEADAANPFAVLKRLKDQP
jgi:uncharacterized metal-binding protein YceD (DUF177 family)